MKASKRILTAILIVAVCVCCLAVATFAEGPTVYNGTLAEAQALLDQYGTATTLQNRAAALQAVEDYLQATPVDPATDGYAAFAADLAAKEETVCTELCNQFSPVLTMLEGTTDLDQEANLKKAQTLCKSADFAATYPFVTKVSGYAAYGTRIGASKVRIGQSALTAAQAMLATVDDAATVDDKFAIIEQVNAYVADYYINTTAEYETFAAAVEAKTAEVQTAVRMERATEYLDAFDALYADLEQERVNIKLSKQINLFHAYVKENPIPDTAPGYAAFAERVAATEEKWAKRLEDSRAALDASTPLEDYFLPNTYGFFYDFDSSVSIPHVGNVSNGNIAKITSGGDGANKYFTVGYCASGKDTHTYVDPTFKRSADGYVVEFDFTSFDQFPTQINFEAGENGSNGGRVFPNFFSMKWGNGTFNIYNNRGAKEMMAEDPFVIGEWSHMSFVWKASEYTMYVYLEYELIGTCLNDVATVGADFEWSNLRMGYRGNAAGSFSIDNLNMYEGSSVRNNDRFDKMADDAKFLYYVDYFQGVSNSPSARKMAYDQAKSLVPFFWDSTKGEYLTGDADVRAAVDIYNNYSIQDILDSIRKANLQGYITLAQAAVKLDGERTLANVSAREASVKACSTYLSSNEVDTTDPEYIDLFDKVKTAQTHVEEDTVANTFIIEVNRFQKAISFAAMEKHYLAAKTLYDAGLNYAVYQKMGETGFLTAYETFGGADKLMAKAVRDNNTKKFINCVGFVSVYTTEDEWIENYDYIAKYLKICRNILYSNDYNASDAAFLEAKEAFDTINAYFWADLQRTHIEILSEELAKFPVTDYYIEKVGVCTFIKQYIATNEVDYENEEIRQLLATMTIYEAELEVQKEEYDQYLEQNTTYFMNLVAQMQAAPDYPTFREYYDLATDCFYAMNISNEEVQAAVDIYTAYRDYVAEVEMSALLFIGATEQIAACETREQTYEVLVACFFFRQYIDTSVDGVAEALAVYETALAAYNGEVASVNGDIAATQDAVCQVRAIANVAGIVAVVRKYFH